MFLLFIACNDRRVTASGRVAYDGNTDKEGILNPVSIDEADSNVSSSVAVASYVHKYIE